MKSILTNILKCDILLFSLFLLTNSLFCQSNFTKTFGENEIDYGYSVIPTHNGYAISSSEDGVLQVIKVDSTGELIWKKNYDFIQNQKNSKSISSYIIQTADSNYVLVGKDTRTPSNSFILKINTIGDTLWLKSLSHPFYPNNPMIFRKLIEDQNRNLIIIGSVESIGTFYCCLPVVFQTDSLGNLIANWGSKIACGSKPGCRLQEIYADSDGNYLVSGETFSENKAPEAAITKLNSTGEAIWHKRYDINSAFYGITQAPDDGYVLVGLNWLSNDGTDLFKIDVNGNLEFRMQYKVGPKGWHGSSIDTTDNGFFISGSLPSDNGNITLLKLNSSFEVQNYIEFGGVEREYIGEMQSTPDGGCVIVGTTTSFGSGESDIYFIKTNPEGEVVSVKTYRDSPKPKLYPQPSQGIVYVSNASFKNYSIYNSQGQQVLRNTQANGATQINISHLANGLYFLHYSTSQGQQGVEKVVLDK